MKNRKLRKPLGVLIFIAVLAVSTLIVMLLWNWLMPAIFGLGAINFWQSAGLIILCRLLFGGFGKWGHGGPPAMRHGHMFHHHPAKMWAMRDKFRSMSREERDEYIRRHMDGCERMHKGGEPGTDGSCEG